MTIVTETVDIKSILETSRNIAVLGASVKEHRPAYYVPDYLAQSGYAIFPVNPTCEGTTLFGKQVAARLSDLPEPIDIVNVFRRSENLPDHLEDILAMTPKPKVVWFQLGIRNDEVAEKLSDAGITVVQDRCMLVDHQRLL